MNDAAATLHGIVLLCVFAGLPAWLPPPANLYQTEQMQHAAGLGEMQQPNTHPPSVQQQQQQQQLSRPSSPFGLRGLFSGFASPRAAAAAAAAAVGAAAGDSNSSRACLSGQQMCSLSGSGCSSLSSEAQAALQAEMVKFFGLNR
jgi:hypothetical protein